VRHSSKKPAIDLAAAVLAANSSDSHKELTLSEVVRAYSVSHCDESDLRLRKWLPAFGDQSAWAITSDALEAAALALREHGYAPASVNRDLSSLGSVYKWAKSKRLTPRGFRSPTLSIRRFEEPIRRVHIDPADLDRLRDASRAYSDPRFGAFVALLIDTGARKSEILERRWAEVDLDRREILAPTTKNGTPRILFFSVETEKLLTRLYPKRPATSMLFEGQVLGQPVDYRRAWSIVTREAKLNGLHMHDVRHAAAANLLKAGVTLGVAAQVLGHDPAVLARRYGHLETAALRDAQEQAWRQSR